MKYQVRHGQRSFEVEIHGEPPHYTLSIDGHEAHADAATLGDDSLLSILLENVSFLAHAVPAGTSRGRLEVSIAGKSCTFDVLDELSAMAQQMHAPQAQGRVVLESPMPGMVVGIRVSPGERVEPGTPLVVVEAMKMQNELASEVHGVVHEVPARLNQPVESGAPLIVIEADGSDG
jgi:biotin carboxyl carrier protein